MPRQRRTDQRIPQFQFSLIQIGLAHRYRSFCSFVSSLGIVQIQLAGSVLRIEGADTLQIALCLQCLRFILLQLCTGFVSLCPILFLVYHKKYLVLGDICSFCEKHILQIPFHTRTYLYKLLGANTSHVLSIYLHISFFRRFHNHGRSFRFNLFRPSQNEVACQQYRHAGNHHQQPLLL